MTKVSELVSQNIGNQILNYQTWGSILFNPVGAKGDGVTNDSAAIAAAIANASVSGGIVVFKAGTYVTDNQNVPANVTLWFANGAKLSINTGKIVTINGSIEAGLYQIFSGAGVVVGQINVPYLYPQWWGANGTDTRDNSPAINACIVSAQSVGYEVTIFFPPGSYKINTSIIIRMGLTNHNLNIVGYGARLIAGTANQKLIMIQAWDGTSGGGTGLTNIMGFRMYGSGNQSYGIFIGKTAKTDFATGGITPSIIKDIQMENVQYGVCLSDTRLWRFDNVNMSIASVPTSCGFLFQSIFDGFTGDCWLTNCNIVVETANGRCILLIATSVTGISTLNGIHIDNCVFYGPGVYAQTTNANSTINDIFITSCANDAGSPGNGINLNSFSNRTIESVFITSCWINGMIQGIYTLNCFNVIVMGGKISGSNNQAIKFDASSQCKAVGVTMYDNNKGGSGGGIVHLSGTGVRNKVTNCNIYNTAYTNQFILMDVGQTKPIVTSNQKDAAGIIVNNVAGVEGTDFIIAGNL